MRIAICTNLSNGIGLQREFELLRDFLVELGHEVHGLQYDEPLLGDFAPCDLMISIETVSRHLLSAALVHWLFPNPEWFTNDLIPVVKRHFSKVLTKTKEAQRIFEGLFPGKTFYTGFLTRDQMDPTVLREKKFLHIGGNGALRNTQAVLDAWRWKKDGRSIAAPLTIISQKLKGVELPEGVTVFERITEKHLKWLQNSHAFHLYPSATEGFGHGLHEAMSVGAVVLTTNAPPMNEGFRVLCLIEPTASSFFGMAQAYEVSALDIYSFAELAMGQDTLLQLGNPETRGQFEADNEAFKKAFSEHLPSTAAAVHKPLPWEREFPEQKRIAFLGNFRHSFCTEADLAWSFEHLGHEIIRVQEDLATLPELMGAVLDADMFLWVHTHGWKQITSDEMESFLEFLGKRGIPSVSFHLDKYWGIPERENRIGADNPFWMTDFVFTADGGFQEQFLSRGVNHFWMPPAVVERAVHHGFPRTDLRCDVAFVGATTGYHEEYPFRSEMINTLRLHYRGRFKTFEGVRESGLNDIYASAKVVVGDCIFAGTPRYWSDRLPETCGRGGFILFPRIEGMTIPCATYVPQDLPDLIEQIDRWVELPVSRRKMVEVSMQHVRENDTYTSRVLEILDKVFG